MAQDGHRTSVVESADLFAPMALRVAATLRLADLAKDDGSTAAELAPQAGVDAVPLGRLLDHLVTLGAFDHDEESGRYAVTEWGRQLRADDPHPMRFSLDLNNTVGRAQLAAVELLHTVTADEAGYTRMYGRDFYTDLAENPALRASFDASMEQRIRSEVAELVKGFDWSRFRRLVDLGGGDGYLLAAVLQAHPHLRGTVLERGETVGAAAARLAASGLGERADVVQGDFFDSVPEGADLFLLSDILHNWPDDKAATLLENCAKSMPPDGALLVVETMLDGEPGQALNTTMDLSMWTFLGGRERTQANIVGLAERVGLILTEKKHLGTWRNLLEFRPA